MKKHSLRYEYSLYINGVSNGYSLHRKPGDTP